MSEREELAPLDSTRPSKGFDDADEVYYRIRLLTEHVMRLERQVQELMAAAAIRNWGGE